MPVGLIFSKIVFRSLRSVTLIENTHKAANEHFKQILDRKPYIWWLVTTDTACNKISDIKSASRKILEKTSSINMVVGEISYLNLTYLDKKLAEMVTSLATFMLHVQIFLEVPPSLWAKGGDVVVSN